MVDPSPSLFADVHSHPNAGKAQDQDRIDHGGPSIFLLEDEGCDGPSITDLSTSCRVSLHDLYCMPERVSMRI